MSIEAAAIVEEPAIDPIDAIIAAHNGDARAAVTDLVHRIQHLRHQLSLSSAVMSKGMTRGWQPSLDQT